MVRANRRNLGSRSTHLPAQRWQHLTPYQGRPSIPNKPYRVKLERSCHTLTAWVDDQIIDQVSVTEPHQQVLMNEPQRFKFHSTKGGLYSIQNAVLVEGP